MIFTFGSGGDTNAAKKELYEALQYSGLVTEGMTFDEMCEVLAAEYPEIYALYKDGVNGGAFNGFACSINTGYEQYAAAPKITFGDTMKVETQNGVGGVYRRGAAITKSIDLTRFKKLKVTHYSKMIYSGNEASDNWRVDVFITPVKATVINPVAIENLFKGNGATVSNIGTVSIDVSGLTGEYHIGVYVQAFGSYETVTEVSNMYLE